MKMYSLLTLCLVLCLSLPAGSAAAQDAGSDVYAPVAEHLRARLRERLREYVEAERAQQFDRLYDLFSKSEVEWLKTRGRGTKSEYVAFQKGLGKYRIHLVDFAPTRITEREDGVFIIYGRYKNDRGEVVVEGEGSINARWERGDWYFSVLGVEIE